ncbi:MAG: DoxX family protein [Myxococcales bacterium]|nr:DoxX family protein [Myxococcales bacterium]
MVPRKTAALIGRIFLAGIFVVSGIAKLTDTAGTAGYMTAQGIPYAHALAIFAGLCEIAGGLAIAFGFLSRLAAIGLFLFLIPTTLVFHNFWALDGAEAQLQMVSFLKNLAIMGGLLLLWAQGPNRLSVDARLRRPLDA